MVQSYTHMVILEILQNIVVTILIGYLGLTNSLASYIENLFLPQEYYEESEDITLIPTLNGITSVQERTSSTIPRVLLENRNFQQAALLASRRSENVVSYISEKPVSEIIEESLVNIFCQYKTDRYIRTTTGTGFFINPKGVILTNAHVAQFLLLEGVEDVISDVNCTIRTGNPAVATYKAKLLYISPTWIFENAKLIASEAPRGTGERDYALLYVSESLDKSPLPANFPAITINTNLLSRGLMGTSVLNAGYPAEKLIRTGSDADLIPVVAEVSVGTLYTFGSNYADIFSVSNSSVGEQGASGGPVVDLNSGVIGLIVTKGDERTEGLNSLRALTLSYVDRTIIEETGFSLQQNMLGDIALRGTIFENAIGPFLRGLLKKEL